MRSSVRETALRALLSRLNTAMVPVTVQREATKPTKLDADGLAAIMRDGDPGDPEATISVVSYAWTHQATLEIYCRMDLAEDWRALIDRAILSVCDVLTADHTLGGTVDHALPGAPNFDPADVRDALGMAVAEVPITLWYQSVNPTG